MKDEASPEERPRRAVALRHDTSSDAAPRVVAQGAGDIAERICELAAEHGVPLVEDRDLVALLAACEIGREVPEELFEIVARLLAFLYELNGELKGSERT